MNIGNSTGRHPIPGAGNGHRSHAVTREEITRNAMANLKLCAEFASRIRFPRLTALLNRIPSRPTFIMGVFSVALLMHPDCIRKEFCRHRLALDYFSACCRFARHISKQPTHGFHILKSAARHISKPKEALRQLSTIPSKPRMNRAEMRTVP